MLEKLYFIYCFKLGRTEKEFFESSLIKVLRMVEVAFDGFEEDDIVCDDMTDFLA